MARQRKKIINLALQGGGAHGAFTWGVLDRLLEDDRIAFEAISGTSAGAMNAVVMADGYKRGGASGAREHLESFWKEVSYRSGGGPISGMQTRLMDTFLSFWNMPSYSQFPFFEQFQPLTSSPYDFNPLNINPLSDIIHDMVDFDSVRACDAFKLYISATRVRDGKVKIFKRKDMSADVVMASACLPFLFQAVTIKDEAYWDGGYMGNPALFPFFTETKSEDIILVQINPIERPDLPRSAKDILERISEITFNASLLREFRAIDFVNRLIEDNKLDPKRYKKNRLHRIDASEELALYGTDSKFDTGWHFFKELRDIGRKAADDFFEQDYDKVGRSSTLDIRAAFSS